MKPKTVIQTNLTSKFERVRTTPAGFSFFVSVHDFVKYIESNESFNIFLKEKASRGKEIPMKYFTLRQIYQGIEDIDRTTNDDLGHDRYVAIRELNLIRKNEATESNSLWKRREATRKLIGEIYRILDAHLSQGSPAA